METAILAIGTYHFVSAIILLVIRLFTENDEKASKTAIFLAGGIFIVIGSIIAGRIQEKYEQKHKNKNSL